MSKFGERLKDLRLERKMTQKQLAEILKCSEMAVSHWESGNKETSFDTLIKIVQVLKTSSDYLLGIKDTE